MLGMVQDELTHAIEDVSSTKTALLEADLKAVDLQKALDALQKTSSQDIRDLQRDKENLQVRCILVALLKDHSDTWQFPEEPLVHTWHSSEEPRRHTWHSEELRRHAWHSSKEPRRHTWHLRNCGDTRGTPLKNHGGTRGTLRNYGDTRGTPLTNHGGTRGILKDYRDTRHSSEGPRRHTCWGGWDVRSLVEWIRTGRMAEMKILLTYVVLGQAGVNGWKKRS